MIVQVVLFDTVRTSPILVLVGIGDVPSVFLVTKRSSGLILIILRNLTNL